MRSAFNLLVSPNSMFTPFLYDRAMCSLENLHLEITIIIIARTQFYFSELSGMNTRREHPHQAVFLEKV